MKCSQPRPVFELVAPSPFPTTTTIAPQAPPFLFAFNVPLVEFIWFRSLPCMSTNPWPTSRVPDGIAWCCSTLRVNLIQFSLHLMQITEFAFGKIHPYNKTSSTVYSYCDTGSCCSFTNTTLHIDLPVWTKHLELWFVSPKTLFLFSIV